MLDHYTAWYSLPLLDNVDLKIGTGAPAKIRWDTTDANANHLNVQLPTGGAVDVPVLVVGIGINGVDLGLFNGDTQPMVATIDADRDSFVGFHFSADDVAVVEMKLAADAKRQHTIPNVTSDVFTLNAATQTLTAKTLTSPIVGTQITLDQATADYTFTWANPAAARAISIVDPGGTDVFTWRDAAQTLLNKTLTAPDINAGTADSLTSLSVRSTGAAFDLLFTTGVVFTASRTLNLSIGDSDRTITLTGNPTLADWFDQAVKAASSPTFVNLTITSFAANWTNAGRTVADLGVVTTVDINGGTVDSLTSLSIRSTGAAFNLLLATGVVFTASRTLNLSIGDADRTITLTGNPTLADWFDQAVKVASSPTFVNLTITSFAANWTNAGRTVADLGVVTTVDLNGGTVDSLTSLSIRSTGAAFDLTIATATVFTAGRTLTIDPGDAARTITLSGSPTLNDWFDQSVKTTANPTFGNLTITSFAANWTNAGRTVADLGVITTVDINGGTIDGVTIGGASAGAGTFTSITASLATSPVATYTQNQDATPVEVAVFQGDRATPADGDEARIAFKLSDSAGNQDWVAGIGWQHTTVLNGATQDGDLVFYALVNNTGASFAALTEMLRLDGSENEAYFTTGGTETIRFSGRQAFIGAKAGTPFSYFAAPAMGIAISPGNTNIQAVFGITDDAGTRNVAIGSVNNFTFNILVNNIARVAFTAAAITLNQATTLAFGAFDSTISASSAGVARSITYNITVGAGGAANAQLSQQFQLDSVFEAGLSGETDGAGGVTAATQVWKVPYRDSGANVAAPAALNVEVLGGLRVEAGDDTNRIYFRANAAWHYINQTAGFSFLHKEPTTFGDHNDWEYGEVMVLKVDRYNENDAHALPYPFEQAIRDLIKEKPEFRAWLKAELVEA